MNFSVKISEKYLKPNSKWAKNQPPKSQLIDSKSIDPSKKFSRRKLKVNWPLAMKNESFEPIKKHNFLQKQLSRKYKDGKISIIFFLSFPIHIVNFK